MVVGANPVRSRCSPALDRSYDGLRTAVEREMRAG